jgi:hypothetical protein
MRPFHPSLSANIFEAKARAGGWNYRNPLYFEEGRARESDRLTARICVKIAPKDIEAI